MVALVAVQAVGPQVAWVVATDCGVEVEIAVEVVVGKTHAVSLTWVADAGRGRDVGKAVAAIVEQRIGFKARHYGAAVGQVDVD